MAKKEPFLVPKKRIKRAMIIFSLKFLLVQFLAKFMQQKKAKKAKNMAKKGIFGPKSQKITFWGDQKKFDPKNFFLLHF